MKMSKANYRRGGLFMLPFVIIAIVIAVFVSAPTAALISIASFGLGMAVILILIGDRRKEEEKI